MELGNDNLCLELVDINNVEFVDGGGGIQNYLIGINRKFSNKDQAGETTFNVPGYAIYWKITTGLLQYITKFVCKKQGVQFVKIEY